MNLDELTAWLREKTGRDDLVVVPDDRPLPLFSFERQPAPESATAELRERLDAALLADETPRAGDEGTGDGPGEQGSVGS